MDENNINNIRKFNSINFANKDDTNIISKEKNPLNNSKQINHIKHLKSVSNRQYLIQKEKYIQKNNSRISPSSTKFINDKFNIEKNYSQISNNNFKSQMARQSPVHSFQFGKKNINTKIMFQNNGMKNTRKKIIELPNNFFNNNSNSISYNNSYSNINNSQNNTYNNTEIRNDYLKTDIMMLKNKTIEYEKKINQFKTQNKYLINQLNFYLRDSKLKAKQIQNLQQMNNNLKNELNNNLNININSKEETSNKNINNNNKNSQNTDRKSQKLNSAKKSSSLINKFEMSDEIKKANYINRLDLKDYSLIDKNINSNKNNIINSNNKEINGKDINNKDNEIQLLHQRIEKMKKNIELLTLKNNNLNNILTKKNIDLMNYQKKEIEKGKKKRTINFIIIPK